MMHVLKEAERDLLNRYFIDKPVTHDVKVFILNLAKKMIPVETSMYKGTIESCIHYENDDENSNITVRKDAEQWDADIIYTCVFWLERDGHVMYEKNNQTHKDEIVKGMVMLFDGETTYIPYIGNGYQRYIIVQLVMDS